MYTLRSFLNKFRYCPVKGSKCKFHEILIYRGVSKCRTKNIKMDHFIGNFACVANSNVNKLFEIQENEKARLG